MKSKNTKNSGQAQQKRRLTMQRKKAVALLSKWASEDMPVEYIEVSSGLRHAGAVTTLSLSPEAVEFMFIAHSGAHAPVFPDVWTEVSAQAIGDFETVHIGEDGNGFTIRAAGEYRANPAALQAVATQIATWRDQNALLHVFVGNVFFQMQFPGRVLQIEGSSGRSNRWTIKHQDLDIWLHVNFEKSRCEVQEHGGHASVQVTDRRTNDLLLISESDMTVAEFLLRFPLADA